MLLIITKCNGNFYHQRMINLSSNIHCIPVASNGFIWCLQGWICGCDLHKLMVAFSFDWPVHKHQWKIHCIMQAMGMQW